MCMYVCMCVCICVCTCVFLWLGLASVPVHESGNNSCAYILMYLA